MIKKLSLLALIAILLSAPVFAQKIVDSVKVYDFPVKEGVIYQYEAKSVYACFNGMPIINVMTKYDSLFHFEEGTVKDIRTIDDFKAVMVENKKQEIVVYSNLKTVCVNIGDKIKRGNFIGVMDTNYDQEMNQVDVLIFQKGKEIPYKKIMSYMQRNISSLPPKTYTL